MVTARESYKVTLGERKKKAALYDFLGATVPPVTIVLYQSYICVYSKDEKGKGTRARGWLARAKLKYLTHSDVGVS